MEEKAKVFGKNLEYLLNREDILQKDLAKALGVSKSTVSMWITGATSPRMDKVKRIAELLNCSISDLLESPAKIDARPVPPQVMIPVLGRVSAGTGITAEENVIGYESADARFGTGEYFYLQVSGDSMSPKIDDGDLVLVHRQTSVDSGTIGVFSVDGEDGFVKKVEYDVENIDLISFNPYYPPMHFHGPDVLRVYVWGKVVKLERRFA